ncbi:MAG: exo-beta-N-acetylmuramidase NamZ family protein [Bacteroidota bacterium]
MIYKWFKNTFLFLVLASFSCNTQSQDTSNVNSQKSLKLGVEQTDKYLPLLQNKSVAILGNQTSVIETPNRKVHLVDTLMSLDINITKVFAPEHGFRGTADAGEHIKDGIDAKTGISVISLYGSNKKPTPKQLEGIDLLVFDIQDVGARFYTYISTLHYMMEACAENNITVLVLDRPNPNGHYIDGPILEMEHQSFVGMHPIPVVHGLTIGEYARMINGENWLDKKMQAELMVIPMKNYARNMEYTLPVKPSPNLPNQHAVNLYPSLCFFEGTTINAGRGTDTPFQVFGSPFLAAEKYNFSYTPKSLQGAKNPKHLGEKCFGENLTQHQKLSQLNLKWLVEAYFNTANQADFFNSFFTKLAGTKKLQQQIETGVSLEEIYKSWQNGLRAYQKMSETYLLYDEPLKLAHH